ncbi:MAG: aminopeptidase [Gammaproteobacteria bacterium]|nr:aminopeptidase [Gammaproteobacteria bacterium]
MARSLGAVAVMVLTAAASGCANLSYYAQSVGGHLDLLGRQQPIHRLLAEDAESDEVLQARLATVTRIRDFASARLALPDNQSYRRYAALDRPYVVWSVVAAPKFSLEPMTWCFLFAGCVNYRGYFDETAARDFAAELKEQGLEVHVGGVPAYSTLGWLADPLPSTVIHWPTHRLAGLIFHELAHQVVYVADDSAFNEAFATAVERAGVRRWLRAHGTDEAVTSYRKELQAQTAFLRHIADLRADLAEIYGGGLPAPARRRAKAEALAAFARRWEGFRAAAGPRAAAYEGWFTSPPNNARLATVALYHDLVPGFEALLQEAEGDLPAFYRRVEALAALDRPARGARLKELTTKYAKNTKSNGY